jgi:Asp-tRNA(Asn)/Glu-tRNA(Gln) amidotransferase A subunit family amidase
MAWTAEDCAILLDAIAGHDPADPARAFERFDVLISAPVIGTAPAAVGAAPR